MGENSRPRFSLSFVVLVVVVEDDDGAPPSLTIAVRSRGDSDGGRGQGADRAPGGTTSFACCRAHSIGWRMKFATYSYLECMMS